MTETTDYMYIFVGLFCLYGTLLYSVLGGDSGKSFNSLEELLNITGINTPEFKPSTSNSDNGVESLSKIARAVENSQQGMSVCLWCISRGGMTALTFANQLQQVLIKKHQIIGRCGSKHSLAGTK